MWTTFRELSTKDTEETEDTVNLILAIITLVGLVGFTIFSLCFLHKNFKKLSDNNFKLKYDSLYQNLDYHKIKALPNIFWFLTRRMAFAALIVFCTRSIVLQVLIADVLSTLLLVFFIQVTPMYDLMNNGIQIVNEIVVLVSVWMMFHFTEFVAAPETRYDLGYYFMYFVSIDVMLNVALLIFTILKKIVQALKNFCRKRLAKRMSN